MIGNLVHYNRGDSEAIAIIVDFFRYEGGHTRFLESGDLLVALEWIKYDKVMPQLLGPSYNRWDPHRQPAGASDENFWPAYWGERDWYRLKNFRVISKANN